MTAALAPNNMAHLTPQRSVPIPLSPLRQTNETPLALTTKLSTTWELLTTNPTVFQDQSSTSIARFFADMYCLEVTPNTVEEGLGRLTLKDLLGAYKVRQLDGARSDKDRGMTI